MTSSVDAHASIPVVKVGGGELTHTLAALVHRIEVRMQRNLPATCMVEFWDTEATAVDSDLLAPGEPLTVTTVAAEEDPHAMQPPPLFDGEIVALELDRAGDGGTRVIVRCYDRGHRLHRSRRTRTFLEQTDRDVVGEIASAHGLTAAADGATTSHEYLCQFDQTDWEFIQARAREMGFETAVDGDRLAFRPVGADPDAGEPHALDITTNLLTFRARASSAAQAGETRVQGYDLAAKEPIQGAAEPPAVENETGDGDLAPDRIAAAFGATRHIVVDDPLASQQSAIDRATAIRAHRAGTAFEADGVCLGTPAVHDGARVAITGIGDRFSGTYTISSATHTLDADGYRTSFVVSGTQDRSLLGLASNGSGNRIGRAATGRVGPSLGRVTDTQDPERLGRVRVELPWLDEQAVSHWAPVVSPGAGPGRGLHLVPELGDLVLVVFELGDPRRPYVLGGVWNGQDAPPVDDAVVDGETQVRTLCTRAGHRLTMDDTEGEEAIRLTTKDGSTVSLLDGSSPAITIATADGESSVVIDGGSGNVTVRAGGDATIEATGDIGISAGRTLTLEGGTGVTVSGGPKVTIEGLQVAIN